MKQFTLRRLLVNVTVLSVVLALVGAFPDAMLSLTLLLILYAPAAVIVAAACFYSNLKWQTFYVVFGGALLGWILAPRMIVDWESPPTFWQIFKIDLQTIGVSAAIGAFIASVVDLKWIRSKKRFGSRSRSNRDAGS